MSDTPAAWTTTEERVKELHERLLAWWFGSSNEGSELKGIWEDAFRRFDERLARVLEANPDGGELVLETPWQVLLECFEGSLDDHDNILAAFPHSLPDGWIEWLPYPPSDD